MLLRIGLIALFIAVSMPVNAQTDSVKEWYKQVALRLSSYKRFPPQAVGLTGAAKVSFVLDRNGGLISCWLEESAGHRVLDEESLALIERSQPFPAPPPELDGDRQTLSIPLVFRGRSGSTVDFGRHLEIEQQEIKVNAKMRGICRGC
jgi:protein TonB